MGLLRSALAFLLTPGAGEGRPAVGLCGEFAQSLGKRLP